MSVAAAELGPAKSEARSPLVFVLPVLALLGGVGAFVGLSKLRPQRPDPTVQERVPVRVQVVDLAPKDVRLDVIGHGTVRTRDTVVLGVEVAGRVAFVATSARTGSFVAEGEVLLRLDPREATIARDQAEAERARLAAEVDRLEAMTPHLERELALRQQRVALAEKEWRRLLQLQPSGAATPSQVEAGEGAFVEQQALQAASQRAFDLQPHAIAQAKAARDVAASVLERRELDLQRLELRSPLPAQVRARDVEVGQYVAPGAPLIGLSGHGVYEVAVQISHEDLTKLALIPQQAIPTSLRAPPSRVGDSDALVSWVGQEGATWPARLVRIETVDPDTRTIPAVVEVQAPWSALERGGLPLLPGAYCEVRLRGLERRQAWVVPEQALREGDRIYLVRADRLVIVPIKVDHLADDHAVIRPAETIQPGDRLVLSPMTFPVAGMRLHVEAAEEGAPPQDAARKDPRPKGAQ